MLFVRILTAVGTVVLKIPGVGPAAQKIAAQLVKNGGKIIKAPKGGFKGPTKPGTPANVAKVLKDLKQSKTGAGRPTPKKPTPKKPTAKKPIAKPGSSASGGKAKKGGLKTKKRTIPKDVKVNKIPKNAKPFGPKTKKQKEAQKKREETQSQNSKNSNRRNPSRDGGGKYNQRPVGRGNVPKSGGAKKGGLKSRLDAKSKKAAAGLGITAVKVSNLDQGELKIKKKNKDRSVSKKIGPNTGSRGSEGDRFKDRTMKKPVTTTNFPERKKVAPKKSPKKEMTFGQKFNAERKLGNPTFTFKDKKYTTRLKEESIKDHKKKFGVTGKY